MITEQEFYQMLGVIKENYRGGLDFVEAITTMEYMLDQTDEDDYFGTEGWKHHLGWG